MNQGCQGAVVEMTGMPSASQVVETGFVVSGVEPTSMRLISSSTIRLFATSAARLGFDWLSLAMTSKFFPASEPRKALMLYASLSAKPASGPVCGET